MNKSDINTYMCAIFEVFVLKNYFFFLTAVSRQWNGSVSQCRAGLGTVRAAEDGNGGSEIPLRPHSALGFHSASSAVLWSDSYLSFFSFLLPSDILFQGTCLKITLVAKWQEEKIKSLLDLNLERSGTFV